MKGKDCCARCYYFIEYYELRGFRELDNTNLRGDGICRLNPKEISKYYKDWCGKFMNNNKHILEGEEDTKYRSWFSMLC